MIHWIVHATDLPFSFVFRKLRVAQGLLFLQCRDAGRSKDGVLRHYEKQCRRSLCGFDAVQHANGYSAKPGYVITSAASAAGNGNGNGKSDCVPHTCEIPETERKMDSARAVREDYSVSRTGKEISINTETPRLEKASGASRLVESTRD
ncbi:MAG TPA: hypothetical protein VFF64_07685 [Candidatus Eremiobacteraceae bacterium]|nr:hypothetical protein [Candidatus Eremiobacteraceae bacterium]